MDEVPEALEKFEFLLKNCKTKEPLPLYKTKKNKETEKLKVDEIILQVSRQIRAIQSADDLKPRHRILKPQEFGSKPQFCQVNMLPAKPKATAQPEISINKFETQCISNTQLINIVQNVEELNNHDGIMLEFDSTFVQHSNNEVQKESANDIVGTQILNETIETELPADTEILETVDISPVLSTKCKIKKVDLTNPIKKNTDTERSRTTTEHTTDLVPETWYTESYLGDSENLGMTKKTNCIDEILFSSDEEDYIPKHSKKIPLTCELDTVTFKENSSILDNTMYVGFQTASNKSIQVCAASFKRARSLLDDIEEEKSNEPTLKELVEVCDKNITQKQLLSKCTSHETKVLTNKNIILPENFRTASNKPIKLSTQALATYKRVFQNIILHDKPLLCNNSGIENDSDTDLFESDNEHTDEILKEFEKYEMSIDLDNIAVENATLKNKDQKILAMEEINCCEDKCIAGNHEILSQVLFPSSYKKCLKSSLDKIDTKAAIMHKLSNHPENNLSTGTPVFDIHKTTLKEINMINENKNMFQPIKNPNIDASNNIVEEPNAIHHLFVGFQTASNKVINVSDEAIAKTKALFKDIDLNIQDNSKKQANPNKLKHLMGKQIENNCDENIYNTFLTEVSPKKSNIDFQKMNDKDIYPSKDPAERDIYILDDCVLNQQINYIEQKSGLIGFHTANNKNIIVSKEALAKTKLIFQDINVEQKNISVKQNNFIGDFQSSNKISPEKTNKLAQESKSFGFQIAHGNNENIYLETLTKTKKDFKNDLNHNEISLKKDKTLEALSFGGFQTASNKKILISKESLAKTKSIFKDIEIKQKETLKNVNDLQADTINYSVTTLAATQNKTEDKEMEEHNRLLLENNTTEQQPLIGFQTASNKKINISKESLAKTKMIFKDIEVNQIGTLEDYNVLQSEKDSIITLIGAEKKTEDEIIQKELFQKPLFVGFHTASNKEIKVSDESLAKTKNIFNNFELNEKAVVDNCNQFMKPDVSKKALVKTSNIFKDITPITPKNYISSNDGKKPEFLGLQTASNKKGLFTEDALIKSKQIFQSFELSQHTQDKQLIGFHTANNKAINVSTEALLKSKKLLQDIEISHPGRILENANKVSQAFLGPIKKYEAIPFKGFATASNKTIKISDVALQKSKKLLQDLDSNSVIDLKHNKLLNFNDLEDNDPPFIGFEKCDWSLNDLEQSKQVLNNLQEDLIKLCGNYNINRKTCTKNNIEEIKTNTTVEEKLIDTQIISNFDATLYTEDFVKESMTPSLKRPSSPILPCPSAKKRKKFAAPYSKTKIKILKSEVRNIKNETKSIDTKETILLPIKYKTTKKYNLKDINNLEKDAKEHTVSDKYISSFEFNTLLDIMFNDERNNISNKNLKTEDIKNLFLNSVNRSIIPEGWLDNHLKLIIWKLISYEVRFPNVMKMVCTARNVINQLAYRYERELFSVERPALRKILEKDDVPGKTLVLCIVGVFVEDQWVVNVPYSATNMELLLTDGWYTVKASIDRMLTDMVCCKKISVGSKILTRGAELVNCEQGVSPWEDTSSIRLKIFGNSTFVAPWWYKLGYHGNVKSTPLSRVQPSGGKVTRMRVLVSRVYPCVYVEKLEDGSVVSRSERLEQLYQLKYEAERQTVLEKLYEEVERELSDQDSQDSEPSSCHRHLSGSGTQIEKRMKRNRDLGEYKAHLTESQARVLENQTTRKREKLIEDIQNRVQSKIEEKGLNLTRNVVQLLKVRIVGVTERKNNVEVTKGLLSVWRPGDLLQELIQEGVWIEVLNALPTGIRYSEVQLTANRQTIFQRSKRKPSDKETRIAESMARKCYHIKELINNQVTDYNEIDTIGLVFQIEPTTKEYTQKSNFQNVFLCDNEKNIVCINFWGGLKKFGLENVLDTGQIVVCVNLQKRSGNTTRNIQQYRATEYTYFTKTPKSVVARQVLVELEKEFVGIDKRKFCDECIDVKNNYSLRQHNNTSYTSPYIYRLEKGNTYKNQEEYDLTGLDFESTFKQTDTQEFSPNTLERKKKVNEKIAKLRRYGEPPPLSPISIINKSKNVANTFKSPLISNKLSDESPKTTIDRQNTTNFSVNNYSPVLQIDRTFIKRPKVNPVKLNFSNNAESDNVISDKDFDEDFDASPPLSLD